MIPHAAVVTGANRPDGIGLALVRALRARGFESVVGTYRDAARSAALLQLTERDAGVLAAELDVTSAGSVTAFGAWCAQHLGRVDLLVNNAGAGTTHEPITRAPIAALDAALQVHAVGMLRVTQTLLPLMAEGAVVANISSSLGSLTRMGSGSTYYAPAKALQNALTRQLAAALRGDGIVAFSVCPGSVATSMGGPYSPLSPDESATALAEMMLATTSRDAGTFRDIDGSIMPW